MQNRRLLLHTSGEAEDVAPWPSTSGTPPAFGSTAPSGPETSAAVAVTDKLDTWSGIFGINASRSGRDPLRARRATLVAIENLGLDW